MKEKRAEIFSYIYVERSIQDHGKTKEILSHFPTSQLIAIQHYKDVFSPRSNLRINQKEHPQLILAEDPNPALYPGAPVCHNFGNENFYYTGNVKNCFYHCEYCYLQGMYSCGHIVVFVNQEKLFERLEALLKKEDVYLSISYDTDLLALESITGFLKDWMEFLSLHENLQLEVRTKCAGAKTIQKLGGLMERNKNAQMIFAFSLNPEEIIQKYEKKTPSLRARLQAVKQSLESGFSTRLCFDPMIYTENYRDIYKGMYDQIRQQIPLSRLKDVSVGSFRISKAYMKEMRKQNFYSEIAYFPYECKNGYYHYPYGLDRKMEEYLCGLLEQDLTEEQIFRMEYFG